MYFFFNLTNDRSKKRRVMKKEESEATVDPTASPGTCFLNLVLTMPVSLHTEGLAFNVFTIHFPGKEDALISLISCLRFEEIDLS